MRLEGKVALISGGARGMGAVEAKLFAEEGAKVVIGDILEEEGRKVETEIRAAGGEAQFVKLDVTREEDWSRAVEASVSHFGKLNVLVNNAGISGSQWGNDLTQEAWDAIMEVNATGVYLGTKAALPEMRKAGGGSIINISSQMGIVGSDATHPAYNASKGAVRTFTKSIAIQYAKDNIRCNSVHPGPIDTPMADAIFDDPQKLESVRSKVPMGRIGNSGGLHGVGVSVVNALSERLDLIIWRNDREHFIRFADGEAEAPLEVVAEAEGRTGTEVTFLPSKKTFSMT
ncbi:MAG: SDR family NAD(P)-dependent oxidoreductase, partial [Dehalococcoidia bacterium]